MNWDANVVCYVYECVWGEMLDLYNYIRSKSVLVSGKIKSIYYLINEVQMNICLLLFKKKTFLVRRSIDKKKFSTIVNTNNITFVIANHLFYFDCLQPLTV